MNHNDNDYEPCMNADQLEGIMYYLIRREMAAHRRYISNMTAENHRNLVLAYRRRHLTSVLYHEAIYKD